MLSSSSMTRTRGSGGITFSIRLLSLRFSGLLT
jgi:hypothetical protein